MEAGVERPVGQLEGVVAAAAVVGEAADVLLLDEVEVLDGDGGLARDQRLLRRRVRPAPELKALELGREEGPLASGLALEEAGARGGRPGGVPVVGPRIDPLQRAAAAAVAVVVHADVLEVEEVVVRVRVRVDARVRAVERPQRNRRLPREDVQVARGDGVVALELARELAERLRQ